MIKDWGEQEAVDGWGEKINRQGWYPMPTRVEENLVV